MNLICIISRESYIKARIIKIKTTEQNCIQETINLANNGISPKLLSHARIAEGYQMFLHEDADGKAVCDQILEAFRHLPSESVVIEKINC